jgi:anti-sigma B factor antagonist/stage II sporulation protein AA (anti-sigma F factor antagonist)
MTGVLPRFEPARIAGGATVATESQPTSDEETSLSRHEAGTAAVLTVSGEIDITTGTRLRTDLAQELNDPRLTHVIVDLTSVMLMSSTGIAVLVDANNEAQELGKSLCIVAGDNQLVCKPLRMTGVDKVLQMRADLRSALALCSPINRG